MINIIYFAPEVTTREYLGIGISEYSCCKTPFLSIRSNRTVLIYKSEYSWVVKIRNALESKLKPHYVHMTTGLWGSVSIMALGHILAPILPPMFPIIILGKSRNKVARVNPIRCREMTDLYNVSDHQQVISPTSPGMSGTGHCRWVSIIIYYPIPLLFDVH